MRDIFSGLLQNTYMFCACGYLNASKRHGFLFALREPQAKNNYVFFAFACGYLDGSK